MNSSLSTLTLLTANPGNVYIIAEIGQNHQGDKDIAKELMVLAKQCGANCVKFQKSDLLAKFNKAALDRPYGGTNSWGPTYASAMDINSVDFLQSLNVPFIKIGSGDAENIPLLRKAAALQCPLLVSTGMCKMESVVTAYNTIAETHNNFALMHCVSSYPTPVPDLNLNVITTYKQAFPNTLIGYSGHELGYEPTLTAVKLGACIVERHFTLNKQWKGSDHASSLTPLEFTDMIYKIRSIGISTSIKFSPALGSFKKDIQRSEIACMNKLGKSLVAGRYLHKGHVLTSADIEIKVAEPFGIPCKFYPQVIGYMLLKDLEEDQTILLKDIMRPPRY